MAKNSIIEPGNVTSNFSMVSLTYWDNLSKIGNNRIYRSSYFWLIFIPIITKVIDGINRKLEFNLGNNHIILNIDLPFSWKLFFLAAIFFSLGNLIFTLFCPTIIKRFDNYNNYLDSGLSNSFLVEEFERFIDFYKRNSKKEWTIYHELIDIFISSFGGNINSRSKKMIVTQDDKISEEGIHYIPFNYISNLSNDDYTDMKLAIYNIDSIIHSPKFLFWELRNIYSKYSHTVIRIFMSIFYFLGFFLFSIVLSQNIVFVLNHIVKFGL